MQADTEENRIALCNSLNAYGISVTAEQARLLLRHLDLVIEKNKVLNLTRITSIDEGIDKHIIDSLLLTKTLDTTAGSSFLDIGTGAGFPGIPIAIVTNMKGTLIDSVGKKVAAVTEFINDLQLSNAEATQIRAEELANTEPEKYDYVVARAVAETAVLLEYATPLLKKGGKAIIAKATPSTEELRNAQAVAEICGMRNVSRETYELPHSYGARTILIYEKVKKPRIKLPRAVGMAKHHPLYG